MIALRLGAQFSYDSFSALISLVFGRRFVFIYVKPKAYNVFYLFLFIDGFRLHESSVPLEIYIV